MKIFHLNSGSEIHFYCLTQKLKICTKPKPDSYYEFELQGPTWLSSYNINSDKGDVYFTQE